MADRKEKKRGPLYCRPEKRGTPKLARTNPAYCPDCNLKIRNTPEGHYEGAQHKKIRAHIVKETRQDDRLKTSISK